MLNSSRTLFLTALFFTTLSIAFARVAVAYEAYSFVDQKCETHSGFIVNVDGTRVKLLNLNGQFEEISSTEVEAIFVFNFVSNPISTIHLSPSLQSEMRQITVGDADATSFRGWPIRFIDSLVIFYDEKGKTHVYEMDSLRKIRPVNSANTNASTDGLKTEGAIRPQLDLQIASLKCPSFNKEPADSAIRPTRVLSDEIKVQQFIQDYENGFHSLESFQERTYLYAKPFLFDREDRIGFSSFPNGLERNGALPLFLQWSTGTPYRFQSFTVLGQSANEFSPNSEPFAQIRSDLKAHIFHALLVGNLYGLAEGSNLYTSPGPSGIDNSLTYDQYDLPNRR